LAVNMNTPGTAVAFGGQANTYTGLTNVLNGTLNVASAGDSAFATGSATQGQGALLMIGNGQAGTQATVIDNSNALINAANIVINNTGTFLQQTNGDAMGGFLLNGGTLIAAGTNGNLENAFVALPSAIPSLMTMQTGTTYGLARVTSAPAPTGYNVINVFQGAG